MGLMFNNRNKVNNVIGLLCNITRMRAYDIYGTSI